MSARQVVIESWVISNDDIDTLKVFCALAIFVSHPIAILWILWCVIPWVKEPSFITDALRGAKKHQSKRHDRHKYKVAEQKLKSQERDTKETPEKKGRKKSRHSPEDLSVINTSISIEQQPASSPSSSST